MTVSLLATMLLGGIATAAAADVKRNVLFLSIDDLRPELGCYGVERAHSPAIDTLAKRGLVFDRAYCQIAQCNQTRASMLTGMRPDTIGVHDLRTHFRDKAPDAVTMPQWFRKHGYHAQSFGKIFHRSDPQSWSVPHGFPDRGPGLESMIGPNPGALKRWLRDEARMAGVALPEPIDHWKPTPAYGPLDDALEPTLTDAIIAKRGVELLGEMKPGFDEILTPDALAFIAELQRDYFNQYLARLKTALAIDPPGFLAEPVVAAHLRALMQAHGLVEYYLVSDPDGFLLLSGDGRPFRLVLQNAAQLAAQEHTAAAHGAPRRVREALAEGRAVASFAAAEPAGYFGEDRLPWDEYLVPACRLQGRELWFAGLIEDAPVAVDYHPARASYASYLRDLAAARP